MSALTPPMHVQKQQPNEVWKDEDVLKAFPPMGGEEAEKVTPGEKGNGL